MFYFFLYYKLKGGTTCDVTWYKKIAKADCEGVWGSEKIEGVQEGWTNR